MQYIIFGNYNLTTGLRKIYINSALKIDLKKYIHKMNK